MSTGGAIAGAPAIGNAGLPAIVIVIVIAGLPGIIPVVPGVTAGAALPARFIVGLITGGAITGAALPLPATPIPDPATPVPGGSALVAPA